MKNIKTASILLTAAVACLGSGCISEPVRFSSVGPNPSTLANSSSTGELLVYTAEREIWEGDNTPFKQRTDYSVFDQQHHLWKQVANAEHYSEGPNAIALPPGQYFVRAHATNYLLVEVPILIHKGKTTTVYLDDSWKPATEIPKTNLTYAPNGSPVGWSIAPDFRDDAKKASN